MPEPEFDWKEQRLDEVVKRVFERKDELARTIRIEGGFIRIRYPNGQADYEIKLDRCDTPEKVLNWVLHLLKKTWIERDVIEAFVILACGAHKIQIYPVLGED